MLLQRSDSALEQLQLHYGPLIRYIIAPILPDKSDQDEVFNDVLLRIWDRVDQFDPNRGNWVSWLSTLTRNTAIDRVRKIKPVSIELTDAIPDSSPTPEQELLRKEQQKTLHTALGNLTYDEQILFYRKYYYRQSTAQIAAELGTTERAIEGRLYRIKQKLRKLLGGESYV